MNNNPQNKLIVALDFQTAAEARALVKLLAAEVGMFKVGSQLFTAAGPEVVREIVRSGSRVFLDLKFHDIPNTVAAAAVEATRLGVTILNVHAGGGAEMMKRTAAAVSEAASAEGLSRPSVIAVTVLTSADQATLEAIGVSDHARKAGTQTGAACRGERHGWPCGVAPRGARDPSCDSAGEVF